MWRRGLLGVLLLTLLACGWAEGAQVTIENPKNLLVDEGQVKVLYTMICQEVADTLHVPDLNQLEYPLTLVLGEERERYLIDHQTGAGTIYLEKCDETRFAAAAAMLALHHVLSNEQLRAVVMKSLRRFSKTRPVTIAEARKPR